MAEMISMRHPSGYQMLCQEYSAALYGIIITIVKDSEAAETVLKQTFHHICQRIHEYRHEHVSFLTWALQIARSVSIIHQDKAPKVHVRDDETIEATQLTKRATNEIPNIIDLVLRGHRVSDIATMLNIPVEAVKTSIRNGMKQKQSAVK